MNIVNRCAVAGFGLIAATVASTALAQDDTSPLYDGTYIAPMASGLFPGDGKLKTSVGGQLGIGYRRGWYALEMMGDYARVPFKSGGSVEQFGGGINGLMFPFSSSSSTIAHNFYGLIGLGLLQNDGFKTPDGRNGALESHNFMMTTYSGGVGDLLPLSLGPYEFAIRAEAVYRYGHRADLVNRRSGDISAPNDFNDVLVNLGLQLPLGFPEPSPAPVAAPVAVVPVAAPVDSDGDGVTDDKDQCPNTPAGTQVNDVGCPLPPPCKPPEAGQRVDLSGCAVGDTIVLHGVNFEFDKAKLTVNAQTILDGVADALKAAPDVHVEVDGHTDSRGSDDYNQKLSESRAQAVMQYLGEHGVAADRMSAVGLGETQPIADNDTDEGRELNRRVELKITSAAAPATDTSASAPAGDASPSGDDMNVPPADAPAADAATGEPPVAELPVGQ
ncbi:OmpA family protein [Solimonas terrae]|nr:OmpA family protein [Solimonas terrae]